MAGGHVNRALLQQYYQNPGDTYDDAMTEGAYEVLAQQIDDNWDEYAAHRVAPEIDHPDGSVTGRKIRNGTITADKFVPGALTNETQNALRITQLENNFGAHVAKSVTDAGGVHGLQVETGTWTPYVAGITTPGSHTYAQQNGYYSRIGKLIKIDATVIVSSKDVGWAGAVYIGGLPYPPNLGAWKYISFSVSRFDNVNFASAEQITASIDAGTVGEFSRIRFYKINSGGEVSSLDASDITGTAFHIRVSGVYDIS